MTYIKQNKIILGIIAVVLIINLSFTYWAFNRIAAAVGNMGIQSNATYLTLLTVLCRAQMYDLINDGENVCKK